MSRRTPALATPAQRRRPGRPRGGAVLVDHTQLLVAAERAIRAVGPDVTMQQIAAEAEVTKPILYRTVGDKAAVVDALSEVLVDRIASRVSASIAPDGDPRQNFTASVTAYLEAVDADRHLYLFVNSAGQQHGPLKRRIDRSSEQLVERFAAQGVAVGSAGSPRTWSHGVVGALQTVTLMWIEPDGDETHAGARTVGDIADDITHLLWPGMEAILSSGAQSPVP